MTRWAALCLALLLAADVAAAPLPRAGSVPPLVAAGHDGAEARPVLLAQRRHRPRRQPAARPKPKHKTSTKAVERPTAEETQSEAQPAAAAAPDAASLQRGGRIEFDGRLVQGQTAKSGAIYLFARQRTDLKSMVRERESYRKEILRTVYPEEAR
jgi:hypothetical protein